MENLEQEGLLSKDAGSEKDLLLEDSEVHECSRSLGRNFFQTILPRKSPNFMTLLAFLSICTNTILLVGFFAMYRGQHHDEPPYSIAGLLPNTVEQTLSSDSLYSFPPDLNKTLRDELWSNIKLNRGVVLVDEETVSLHHLDKRARTFPWDPSKRVYFLNVFHQLHCLTEIYKAITHVYEGRTLKKERFEHLIHCIDALRQDTICAADDELLYVTTGSVFGGGQTRQCRDFSKLEEWALENNGCYIFDDLEPPYFVNQRYANCPKDSPYYKTMVESLGFVEDWDPPNPPQGSVFPV